MAATRPVAAIDSSRGDSIAVVTTDPLTLARRHADDLALDADPRPGTSPLSQTALGALGIELLAASAEAAVARVTVSSPGGRGVLLVAAETVASTAANMLVGPGRRAFGAELDAAWTGTPVGRVVTVAVPLASEGDLHVWRIVAVDDSGRQVLEGRCSLGVVAAPTR